MPTSLSVKMARLTKKAGDRSPWSRSAYSAEIRSHPWFVERRSTSKS
jgi:hypothetical protein